MTAALWFRITLKDLYGIEARDNVWYNGRTKALSHGGALGLDTAGPVGVTHHWLTAEQTLDVMLDRGELDACFGVRPGGPVTAGDPTVIDRYGGTPLEGNPRIRKLLDDEKEVIYDYYRKTGVFHANHHVIVQNRLLREHPWVALELFNAFQRSKQVAYERARRQQAAYLYFPGRDFQEQATVLGQIRTLSDSAPWATLSNAPSRVLWSRGCSRNLYGSMKCTIEPPWIPKVPGHIL